jgi:TM2 domain-containing membrane protein YozV
MKNWQKIHEVNEMKKKDKLIESILWSIALPGFSQILNGQILKGLLFIALEIIINVNANFNEVIRLSFIGQIDDAITRTNYKWMMFYPCLYFLAMWDAFRDAGGGKEPYAYLPFVFSAYFVTVGLMYSEHVKVFGILLGTLWLPMLCVIPGVILGLLLKRILNHDKG